MISGVAYSASKFGMAALNQSINVEFREDGIRACCIYPGEVDTPILAHRPNPVSDAKRAAALLPEDIAAAALHGRSNARPRPLSKTLPFFHAGWSGDSVQSARCPSAYVRALESVRI